MKSGDVLGAFESIEDVDDKELNRLYFAGRTDQLNLKGEVRAHDRCFPVLFVGIVKRCCRHLAASRTCGFPKPFQGRGRGRHAAISGKRSKSRENAKGRDPFRDLAQSSDFSKTWFGFQITATCHFRIIRDLRAEPAFPVPRYHMSLQELLFIRGSQFPECCVSLALDSLAGFLSDSPAGFVSDAVSSSVAGTLPSLVLDSHPELLRRSPCEFRFRFS